MLNIAMIGAGYIAQNHIAAYRARKDVAVTAVICRNAERGDKVAAGIGGGCRHHPSLASALAAGRVDVVDVCTPSGLHEENVVAAAEAGCHVICEKPVTFDLESFDRMRGACERNNVVFMVAQVARWWPEFKTIKRYVDEGRLGGVHMVYEKRLCQHPTWSTWHRDPGMSGGGLYDLNIHDIDFLHTLFGMPESVYAAGWKSPTGCWNHVITTLKWKSGAKAVCETSLEMTGNFPFSIEFRGTGDAGTLSYNVTVGLNINDGVRKSNLVWYPAGSEEAVSIEVDQTDMFAEEIDGFLDSVMNGAPLPVTSDEVRHVLEITLAIKESLETGKVVEF